MTDVEEALGGDKPRPSRQGSPVSPHGDEAQWARVIGSTSGGARTRAQRVVQCRCGWEQPVGHHRGRGAGQGEHAIGLGALLRCGGQAVHVRPTLKPPALALV